jgi:hypothetical protein
LPGGSVFSDSTVVDTGAPDAAPSVNPLRTTRGVNASGRSTQISQGFASSQADAHGNGGVGVTNLLFGNPQPGSPAVDQLAAQSLWTQTFSNTGATDIKLALNVHIPDMEVGLIGVAPNRDAPSATETAKTEVSLATTINRADGSLVHGATFTFGLNVHEQQLVLGPNNFANFAVLDPIVTGTLPAIDPFASLRDNGDDFDPRFTIDALLLESKRHGATTRHARWETPFAASRRARPVSTRRPC